MPLQRYAPNGYRPGIAKREDDAGEYVKFEDVRKLLNEIYDKHRDFGSSEWDAGVADTIQDVMAGMGIDHQTEMRR